MDGWKGMCRNNLGDHLIPYTPYPILTNVSVLFLVRNNFSSAWKHEWEASYFLSSAKTKPLTGLAWPGLDKDKEPGLDKDKEQ